MNALPCAVTRDLNAHQCEVDREADYQARIEAKAVQLRAEYRQDADMLWQSLGDVTARKEASDVRAIVKVLRDGGTLHELAAAMHGLRELVLAECDDSAECRAEGEVQKEDEREQSERAASRANASALARAYRWGDEL